MDVGVEKKKLYKEERERERNLFFSKQTLIRNKRKRGLAKEEERS